MGKTVKRATKSTARTNDAQARDARKQLTKIGDNYENFASIVGTQQRTTLSAGDFLPNEITKNRTKLEYAYRGNWVVGVVCDAVADDMTRAGIDITTTEGAENVKEIKASMSRLGVWNSLADGIRWGRLYGGAIALLQIEGQDLETELDYDTIGKGDFKGLAVYDRWQLQPDLQNLIDSGPHMGLPEYYSIIATQDLINTVAKGQDIGKLKGQIRVHHSRVIRFSGIPLPYMQAIGEQLWGESIIERIYDILISFCEATGNTANLIQKAHLRVVKIEGLRKIISAGGKSYEGLVKMFASMREMQTTEGLTIMDSNDDYSSTAYSFAGLPETVLQFAQQLSGASGIPLVRFYGQAPKGLNATGESDFRNYYDNINSWQENRLREGVEKVLKATHRSLFDDALPSDTEFVFTPLWQMTAKEKSEVGKNTTESILGAYADGIIDLPTALRELRQNSKETGLFSNITDEMINEAEKLAEDPPLPPVANNPENAKPAKAAGVSKTQVAQQAGGPESVKNNPAAQKQNQQAKSYSGDAKGKKKVPNFVFDKKPKTTRPLF